ASKTAKSFNGTGMRMGDSPSCKSLVVHGLIKPQIAVSTLADTRTKTQHRLRFAHSCRRRTGRTLTPSTTCTALRTMLNSLDDRDGLIWLDGELLPWREARLHVLTHALHMGGAVFRSEEHTSE